MSAEDVRRRSFSTAFRGFDQGEVRTYLERLADEIESGDQREKELRAELREARDRVLHPRLDEDTLTSALGEEAARILRSAHEAAADVRRKAEEHAARVLGEAHKEGERIKGAASAVLGERTAEAEAAAAALRAAAETEAAALLQRARQQAETALEEARGRCESLAADAEELKGRMLGELAHRRRVMNAQVEQLGAGRETLLRALGQVRGLLDQTVDSLDRVATEAKTAADDARQRALTEPEPDVADLEREAGSALTAPLEGLTGVLNELEESLSALAAGVPAPAVPEPTPPAAVTDAAAEDVPTEEAPASRAGTAAPSADDGAPTGNPAPAAPPIAAEAPDVPPAAGPPDAAEAPAASRAGEPGPGPSSEAPRAVTAAAADEAGPPGSDPDGAEEFTESERRGSSLRLLRRGRGRGSSEPVLSHPPVPDEGVRLIPTPRPPPEPAVEPAAPAAAVAAPEPQEPPAEEGLEASERDADRATTVDELFARLRAEREAAKQEAQAVLAAEATAGDGEPAQAAPGSDATEGPDGSDGEAAVAADVAAAHPEDTEAPLLEARNRVLAPVHERLARRLKRTLQDDQNDVLDRVRARSRGKQGPLLPGQEEHQGTYATAVGPLVEEAFRAGSTFATVFFGVGAAPDAAPNGLAGELAGEVVGQLRGRLGALIEDRVGEEGELADVASSAYRSWRGDRVESLAMDYAVASFTAGLLATVPAGTALRWVVDDDGGPCPDCDDNALAGPTPAGDSFPTGQRQPPAHPGCRCLLAPAGT